MYYAGTGDIEIDIDHFRNIVEIAMKLNDYTLRTGNKGGIEAALRTGAHMREIMLPSMIPEDVKKLAFDYTYDLKSVLIDPTISIYNASQQIQMVLGFNLTSPSNFILIYNSDPTKKYLAEIIANENNIPCFNLYKQRIYDQFINMLENKINIHEILYMYQLERNM